jgi:hypothetical protein
VGNDHQPGTHLSCQLTRVLQVAVLREPEHGKLKNLHCIKSVARKRLMEIVID